MQTDSIISLKEAKDGKLVIEMYSPDEKVLMELHQSSCEPLAEPGGILLEIHAHCNNSRKTAARIFLPVSTRKLN